MNAAVIAEAPRQRFHVAKVLRTGKSWLSVALLGVALWQGVEGGYIYLKAELAQRLIGTAWADTLEAGDGAAIKPWSWADTWPVARLQLPGSEDLYVLKGAAGNSLAFGPGYDANTALPGAAGVSVVAGHRDTHFSGLKHLQKGDVIKLQGASGEWRSYQVASLAVHDSSLGPMQIPQLASADEGSELRLVTCYPFDSLNAGGPLRYVVGATEVVAAREGSLSFNRVARLRRATIYRAAEALSKYGHIYSVSGAGLFRISTVDNLFGKYGNTQRVLPCG